MASDSAVSSVLSGLEGTRQWQEELYRDVHRHPELSHQEQRTAGLVAERLRKAGFEVHEGVGGTGVVGVLRNGDGPRSAGPRAAPRSRSSSCSTASR